MKDSYRTLEQAGVTVEKAVENDLRSLEHYLSRPDIDSLFVPALSDAVRGITIHDRVYKKFNEGAWIVSKHGGDVVGCMAIVPSKLTRDVPSVDSTHGIDVSSGVSFADWGVERVMELSTVVTDRALRDTLKVKGVGAELLTQAKAWVRENGDTTWGFVTDSWVGGDMGGFVDAMNAKAYSVWLADKDASAYPPMLDTLVRIYTDPSKRGPDGPATVVYGIPIEDRDWQFFIDHQEDIQALRKLYVSLEQQQGVNS